MSYYDLSWDDASEVLTVSFGSTKAHNDAIVQEAFLKANEILPCVMGKVLRVNGPMSIPVAFALSHVFGNKVRAIAIYDPKIEKGTSVGGYVVSVSLSPEYALGFVMD